MGEFILLLIISHIATGIIGAVIAAAVIRYQHRRRRERRKMLAEVRECSRKRQFDIEVAFIKDFGQAVQTCNDALAQTADALKKSAAGAGATVYRGDTDRITTDDEFRKRLREDMRHGE